MREMALALDAPLGIHAHNDAGCAVANSLVAVEAGCTQVQGTMNGYGERAGNADLIEHHPGARAQDGRRLRSRPSSSSCSPRSSHFVAETANISPNPHQPYVGTSAFAHKGGVHASAAARLPEAYEHADPAAVGNLARVVVSELAGRASLTHEGQGDGHRAVRRHDQVEVLDAIKELEYHGYSFEAADGSLAIMLKKRLGTYEPLFRSSRSASSPRSARTAA